MWLYWWHHEIFSTRVLACMHVGQRVRSSIQWWIYLKYCSTIWSFLERVDISRCDNHSWIVLEEIKLPAFLQLKWLSSQRGQCFQKILLKSEVWQDLAGNNFSRSALTPLYWDGQTKRNKAPAQHKELSRA